MRACVLKYVEFGTILIANQTHWLRKLLIENNIETDMSGGAQRVGNNPYLNYQSPSIKLSNLRPLVVQGHAGISINIRDNYNITYVINNCFTVPGLSMAVTQNLKWFYTRMVNFNGFGQIIKERAFITLKSLQ